MKSRQSQLVTDAVRLAKTNVYRDVAKMATALAAECGGLSAQDALKLFAERMQALADLGAGVSTRSN